VNIIPSNDNNPSISPATTDVVFVEGGYPTTVFPDIELADLDQTCGQSHLSLAVVTVETISTDQDYNQLQVDFA